MYKINIYKKQLWKETMFKNFILVVDHSLKYNKMLDGLRGIAISLVFIFHIWPDYFSFGYVGVDVFFVLSGYLITKIIYTKLESGSFSFLEFYRNRVRRIFPAMIIVSFSSFLLGYLFLFPDEFLELIKHLKASMFFYQNFRLIEDVGYWDRAAQLKPMLHFWSLSIEEQFYLLWPIIIFIFYYSKIDIFKATLFLSLAMLILPQFFEIHRFYHSLSRFWELSLGGFVFAIEYKKKFEKYIEKISFLSLFLFVGAICISYNNTTFDITKTFLVTFFTGFLILSLNKKGIQKKVLSFPLLVFLGLISFPLYLWHYVVISYFHIFELNIHSHILGVVLIPIVFSYLTYRYIEFYARQQVSYKFAAMLFVVVVVSGVFLQYARLSNVITSRSHLNLNEAFEKQFEKQTVKNEDGVVLIKEILGKEVKNDYILATSTNKKVPYIALIGDSHAYAAYHGFSKVFKEQGYETILLANSSCPPYIGGALAKDKEKIQVCKAKIDDIYSFLGTHDMIKKIVFITRGQIYVEDKGFGLVDGGNIERGLKYESYFLNPLSYNQKEHFYKSVQDTLEHFNIKKEIEFYFLLENPELGFSPRNYMERPFIGDSFEGINKNRVSYDAYNLRQNEYREQIQHLSQSFSNIRLLDPEPLFCDKAFCYAIKDEKMLYSDDDHLSKEGSILQAEGLRKYIFK